MTSSLRFTSQDLQNLPKPDGVRFEIIDGALFVSTAPSWHHQFACDEICTALKNWDRRARTGTAISGPGLIFSPDQDVVPDVVWISHRRRSDGLDAAGHLHVAPELVVEVLSPGSANELRDREIKRSLYARRGVEEYWLVDWRNHRIEVFRRTPRDLEAVAVLCDGGVLTSPLLPDFSLAVSSVWVPPD